MLKPALLFALLLLGAGSPSALDVTNASPAPEQVLECADPAALPATSESERCCKICRKGKACGDSCIARDRECRVGPGCACDG